MAQTFTATATAATAQEAELFARLDAEDAARAEFGPNEIIFLGFDNVSTEVNNDGTYTVTFAVTADQTTLPPTVDTQDSNVDISAANTTRNANPQPSPYSNGTPFDDDGNLNPGWSLTEDGDPVFVGGDFVEPATRNANPQPSPYSNGTPFDDDGNLNPGWSLTEDGDPVFVGGDFVEPATEASSDASMQQAQTTKARGQSTLSARKNQPSSADWRVRLQLAPGANYLYKAGNNGTGAGILKPLHDTDGVVFPYTPSIETSYQAKYEAYDLVHSNYRGYFYKNSSVDAIQVRATFTAQDTKEAAYLLAVIHFFRSVTKMFYGQEGQAGTPPPLVYLSGLGQYQFNQHPCLVSSFNYNLPNDVDYIRANGFNNFGINLENRRNNSSGPSPGGALSVLNRLATNFLPNGSMPAQPPPQPVVNNVNNQSAINSTYVPTRMEISITLLPTQTRSQVSTEFSLKGFASGDLLKRGFW